MVTVALVALALWAAAATLAILVLIRQVSLISVRLDLTMRLPDLTDVGVGPELGQPIELTELRVASRYVLVAVTGTCTSCHDFVSDLKERRPDGLRDELVLLVAGRGRPVRDLLERVPDWVAHVVRDPVATQIGSRLGLSRTLVALHVVDGRLIGRSDVAGFDDLALLTAAAAPVYP